MEAPGKKLGLSLFDTRKKALQVLEVPQAAPVVLQLAAAT